MFDNKIWVLGGVIVFGTNSTRYNDVWFSENGTNWTEATAGSAGWSIRQDHTSIVFDNKIWVLGGSLNTSTYYNDVWSSGINNNSFD